MFTLFLFVSINYNHHHIFKFCSWISSCCGDFNGRSRWIYASLSPATAPTSVSPSIGTIRFSLDINVYLVTKCVKRWHKYVSLSNSSNTRRWWKYACEKMRYTRRHTEPSFPTDASLMEILLAKERNVNAYVTEPLSSPYRMLPRPNISESAWAYLPAWEIFATIQKTSGSIQGMSCIVDSWTFFGCFMCGTQEYPLFGGSHLCTSTGNTMRL